MAQLVDMTNEEIFEFTKKHQDKIGIRIGRLTTTGIAGKNKHGQIYVNAICDCGASGTYDYYSVKSGHTQSCGCYQKNRASETHYIDLTGKTFGYYYVKSRYGSDKNNNVLYNCVCICGNERIVIGDNLVRGISKSCGCYALEKTHDRVIDLTGKTFSNLYVIKMFGYDDDGKTILWLCRCSCGNECVIRGTNLKSGHTKSCGCIVSVGEESIREYLDNHEIKYIRQKRFKDCKDKKTLPFDFYLPEYNIAIEYDGIYHFMIRRNGDTNYQIIQSHDQMKTMYCEENKIKLLRIPYWERHNISQILDFNIPKNADEANSSSVDLSS